jgi:glycosyltransferase involved in cell wall biosynthesis
MQFSFIVLYRNRDIVRVERCLQSIANQTYTDFEIVFLDYGSELKMQKQVEELCSRFPKVRYLYVPTEGWLWCRSHALNLGIAHAKGQYMIIVDVDIMYSPNFAQYFADRISPNKLFLYSCYYLPQNFTKHQTLNFYQAYPFQVNDISGNGLLVAPKQKIIDTGGYDTYFRIWGFEDIDMYQRLKKQGVEHTTVKIDELRTFHQWHAMSNQIESMPKSWSDFMRKFWEFKPTGVITHTDIGKLFDLEKRPAQTIFQKPTEAKQHFTFTYPLAKSYLDFTTKFANLEAGEAICVQQNFDAIPKQANSLLAKISKTLNKLFTTMNISYRITEVLTFEKDLIEFFHVRDFAFYFLYVYENQIADYYWEQQNMESITFVIIKK